MRRRREKVYRYRAAARSNTAARSILLSRLPQQLFVFSHEMSSFYGKYFDKFYDERLYRLDHSQSFGYFEIYHHCPRLPQAYP